MSYNRARAYEAEAARLGVSDMARGPDGFMREYESAGSAAAMKGRPLPRGVSGGANWETKRRGFIARTLPLYKKDPSRRRFLSLVMWAYMPPSVGAAQNS